MSEEPHITLERLRVELAEQKVHVSQNTIWRYVRHQLGLSFKKSLLASEQHRPDIASRRYWRRAYQGRLAPERLVFLDETWIKTNMAPIRGWCARGKRLPGHAPHGHWKTMTFLAALRHNGIEAPCVFDGPINGARFTAWVEQMLCPILNQGDIVILDNLRSHKG